MRMFVDPEPDPEFPYTIFDPDTAEVIDRADNYNLAASAYPGTVIIKTWATFRNQA